MQNDPRKDSGSSPALGSESLSTSPAPGLAPGQTSGSPPAAIQVSDVDFNREGVPALPSSEGQASETQERTGSRLRGHSASERILREAVKGEYRYGMLGLILGLAAILGGVVLGLHGVAGHTSWSANLLGLSSNVNDAGPGVVLFLVGLFMIRSTRPDVDLRKLKG